MYDRYTIMTIIMIITKWSKQQQQTTTIGGKTGTGGDQTKGRKKEWRNTDR